MRPSERSRASAGRRIAGLFAVLLGAVCTWAPAEAAAKAKGGKLKLSVLSSKAEHVTGEDALISVAVPKGTKPGKVRIRRDGANVTGAFEPRGRRLVGVVEGLSRGANLITAEAPGLKRPASLELFDTRINGPVFSGPQQTPFFCRTQDFGLGPATDADCSAPTKVEYLYRTNTGNFAPLADPAVLPPNGVQTTTRDGQTVDYVIRLESGVIDRSIYRWAILAPGGRVADGWNRRLLYKFGGGCDAGYEQGPANQGLVLDDGQLSRGYSVLSGSLNVFGTACNDLLSAEAAAMLKEHVVESLRRRPAWTIGEGGSGGSVQSQLIAQNYPGLLDGVLPNASFPDNAHVDFPDCRLLTAYFATIEGSALTEAQRESITGIAVNDSCTAMSQAADVVRASEGCDETVVPPALIFDPVSNPGGLRCSVWDTLVNVYGTDPATGYARRTLDNVGVQYGLEAYGEGEITLNEFLDLNERIGGFDNDGEPRAERSVGDTVAQERLITSGRVGTGAGGSPSVPIIDVRSYQDESTNIHQSIHAYTTRARLLRANGTYANQVMFRAKGGVNVRAARDTALDTMGEWLDAITADKSGRPLPRKVIANKPADAVDACWTGAGKRTNGRAVIGADNFCENTYPPHSLPDLRAGKPLDYYAPKCELRPLEMNDYGNPAPGKQARLNAVFPGGVCDWQPAADEPKLAGTWQEFGPERVVERRKRELSLKLRRGRSGNRIIAAASMRPCPRVKGQPITIEKRKRGKWRSVGSGIASGGKCRVRVGLRGKNARGKLRAQADSVGAYRSVRSNVRRAPRRR